MLKQQAPPPEKGSVDERGKFSPVDKDVDRGAGAASLKLPSTEAAKSLVTRNPDGTLQLGLVRMDPKARGFDFPASVQLREGLIEYAVVTTKGKVHEALFATEASPLHIHLAALLLNLAPTESQDKPAAMTVEVGWQTNGPPRREPLEKLIAMTRDQGSARAGNPLTPGAWDYVGSSVVRGDFVAEREGSVIALISDPEALMVNPRPTRKDDTLHMPNAMLLPSQGMPVTIYVKASAAENRGQ